jgi:aminoglycoside phosphotransferase (APT) family kinase protein
MKTPQWAPDTPFSDALARTLLEAHLPALNGCGLERIGQGMDSVAYRIAGTVDAWVARFPLRVLGAELVGCEVTALAHIERPKCLRIPSPRLHGGQGVGGYPYRFATHPLIAGQTGCGVGPWRHRDRWAVPLGHFLGSLHAQPLPDRSVLVEDRIRRADLEHRMALTTQISEELHAAGRLGTPLQPVLTCADRLRRTPPWSAPPRWVHGDLYGRHLISDHAGEPVGVIDWGDTHRGDPALDLSIAFTYLPPQARTDFARSYGSVDEDTWARARARALFYGVALLQYGHSIPDPGLIRLGRQALRGALQGA